MMKRFQCKGGVTLVELIIVLAIIGVVSTTAYSLFIYGLKTFSLGERQSDMQFQLRQAASGIADIVRNAETIKLLDNATISSNIFNNSFDYNLKYIYVKEDAALNKKSLIHRIGNIEQTIVGNISGNITIEFTPQSSGKLLYYNLTVNNSGQIFNLDSQVEILNIGSGYIDGTSGVALAYGPITDANSVLIDSLTVVPGSVIGNTITVPLTGPYGSTISWSSDSSEVLSIVGNIITVERSTTIDAIITLKAVFSKGSDFIEKSYNVFIPKLEPVELDNNISPPFSIPTAIRGEAYTYQFTSTGGDGVYIYTASGSIPGLTFNSNGTLSGIPTSTGSYTLNITVADTFGLTDAGTYILNVINPVTVNPGSLPNATKAHTYSYTFSASGGSGGYTFSSTTLPGGLTLASNGTLSGIPTNFGNYSFSVTAMDSYGRTGTRTFNLLINKQTVSNSYSSVSPSTITVQRNNNFTFMVTVKDITNLPINDLLSSDFNFSISGSGNPSNHFTFIGATENGGGSYIITARHSQSSTIVIKAIVYGTQIDSSLQVTVTN